MDITEEVESILYICREISVFKIPPLKANEGHRAQDWGLDNPLWKGRLRITEKTSGVSILFEDSQSGELFAKADYDPEKPCVDSVLDSSRYFVIRIEDGGRKAYIGFGFAERSDSFDFNVALQDYTKRWRASKNPPTEDTPSPHIPAGPKKDYSLKEGQTFSISIPGRKKAESSGSGDLLGLATTTTSKTTTTSSTGGFPLLPPPPSSGKKKT